MKIESVELFLINFPLNEPFIISYDDYSYIKSVIVKITTDSGIVGWGEAVPDEHITAETVESVYALLKYTLIPSLIGQNPMNFGKIHELMDNKVNYAPAAKAAIDIACYDIAGKSLGVPVYQLIGGRYHDQFPITHVLSLNAPDQMADEAERKIKEGYRSFKLKVGSDLLLDVERIKKVSERVGKEAKIRIDVNQGWENSANTLKALRLLEGIEFDWLEQPVNQYDLDAFVELKMKTTFPIMIDEGLKNAQDMKNIIAKNAAHKVNIKLMKCGGIYPAVKLVHMAEMAGMECQIGSMLESSIGSAAGFHVAFSQKNVKSVELTGPIKFAKDVGDLKESYHVPYIKLNEKPGLGISIDENILHELAQYTNKVDSGV